MNRRWGHLGMPDYPVPHMRGDEPPFNGRDPEIDDRSPYAWG